MAAAVTICLAAALLAGCGGRRGEPTPPEWSPPAGSAPSARPGHPGARGGGTERSALAIYYVGPTPAGPRLYREFHSVATRGDAASAAARELLDGHPDDPDYRSAWPSGWTLRGPVRHAGGTITVDLSGPGGPDAPADATWALRQLVYTVQGALGSNDPVRVLRDGAAISQLWGVAQPMARGEPVQLRSLVQIDNPPAGARIGRRVTVSGEADVFEATVLWQVLRGGADGQVVAHGSASTAEGQRFSPYSFVLILPPGRYTLRVAGQDLSNGEGHAPFSDTKTITVS